MLNYHFKEFLTSNKYCAIIKYELIGATDLTLRHFPSRFIYLPNKIGTINFKIKATAAGGTTLTSSTKYIKITCSSKSSKII